MSLLEEIALRKNKLRHCQTVVTNTLGESYLEDNETGSVTKVHSGGSGYVVDTKPDLQLAEIIPGVYLGSQDPTGNIELLQRNDITHVLSLGVKPLSVPENVFGETCGVREPRVGVNPQVPTSFMYIPFLDVPEASLSEVLLECFPVIDSALLSGGKIFVHCNAGVSRSPSVVVAYILYRSYFRKPWASISYKDKSDKPIDLSDAMELVKIQRPSIKPNSGFLEQLKQYEQRLRRERSNE